MIPEKIWEILFKEILNWSLRNIWQLQQEFLLHPLGPCVDFRKLNLKFSRTKNQISRDSNVTFLIHLGRVYFQNLIRSYLITICNVPERSIEKKKNNAKVIFIYPNKKISGGIHEKPHTGFLECKNDWRNYCRVGNLIRTVWMERVISGCNSGETPASSWNRMFEYSAKLFKISRTFGGQTVYFSILSLDSALYRVKLSILSKFYLLIHMR